MIYSPHTGTVTGATKGAGIIAAVKATPNGVIITHLTITPTAAKRDINYPILQGIDLAKIRKTFSDWNKETT